jgi:hypothetical protein
MNIYHTKIAIHGISPMVWRRLRILGNTSLAQLHHIIQVSYGWDDDYLHQFRIYGKDYGIYHIGGMMFSDDPYKVLIDQFEFDAGDKFTYEYNFFDHWLVDIRIETITESTSLEAIYCTKGNGMHGVSKHAELGPIIDLYKAMAKVNSKTTFADIRPFVDAVRFNRHLINQNLQTELEGLS